MAVEQRILVVDDDLNISQLVKLYLEKEGYSVECSANGIDALKAFKANPPSLVVLDLMLPGMDGWEVCREIRKISDIPIIMLTAKGETFDKVLGLELGADDYMVKPFDPKELIARIKAVLRRRRPQKDAVRQIAYPNLSVNISDYTVSYHSRLLELPPKELELLYFLASNPNRVFTREQLLEQGRVHRGCQSGTIQLKNLLLCPGLRHDGGGIPGIWMGLKFRRDCSFVEGRLHYPSPVP
jgi:two-component system OmpR family response regulator